MTNAVLLRQKVECSGYKIVFLAEKVNLSPQGFYKKLNDGTDWLYSQVMILKELLRLKDEEVNAIFFTNKAE